jgi:predicted DNA-binding transcriptional regulator AlpA
MRAKMKRPEQKRTVERPATNEPSETLPDIEECLRVPEVRRVLKVSRSTLHRWVNDGTLEKPLRLGANVIAWRRSSIAAFLKS